MPIKQITKAYVRRYRDNGQTVCYVEWIDGRGTKGRTEGTLDRFDHPHRDIPPSFGMHMHALVRRASREGVKLQRETW